jgi:steroid delta-isomerase-like uncharacterized protein
MNSAEYKRFLANFYHAFPDAQISVEDQMSDENKVMARWTIRGQHQGEFQGVPPTGRSIKLTGMAIWRIVNGRAVEEWVEWDAFGLMQQIGAIPASATPQLTATT